MTSPGDNRGVTTPPAGGVRRPPERYGTPRRRTGFVLAVAVAAVAVALVIWRLASEYGPAPVSGTVQTFRITDEKVELRVALRKPADRAAECFIRARGEDGAEVARRTVTAPADPDGRGTRVFTWELPTPRPAITAELQGCRLLP